MISLFNEPVYWVISHDMNPIAQRLADRHYSRKNPGSKKGFVGPGEKLVLLSPDGNAVFAWLRADPANHGVHERLRVIFHISRKVGGVQQ